MKKKYSALFLLFSSILSARHDYDQSGPLFQPYSFTVRGGIAPSVFAYRGTIFSAVANLNPLILEAFKDAKFGKMWRNYPANIDFDFGYALSNHTELFGEFNYRYAKENNFFFISGQETGFPTTSLPNLNKFQSFAGYAGFRYFFNRIASETFSFFLGLKFGLVNYRKVNAKPLIIKNFFGVLEQNAVWFRSHNVCSGGLQVGFDTLVAESISLFSTAEVVVSGGLRSNINIVKQDQSVFQGFTNIIRESSGPLISFPLTLGVRYYFGGCK
ncbi:MAG: hypothetical protein AB7R69_03840 [Candidatus Babeliales bacterium]